MREYNELINHCYLTGGKVSYIGETHAGYKIPMVTKGAGDVGVLIIGGIHAREYITSFLLLRLLAEYHGEVRVDVIPMLNFDGYLLSKRGVDVFPMKLKDRQALYVMNGGKSDFSLWKANIRGVDLNTNFPAKWGEGEHNIFTPSSENYVGVAPLSELETQAVYKLMKSSEYALVVCYHAKGEEVYWGFQKDIRYKKYARAVANKLNYKLKETPRSTGGIKDVWTLETGRLGLTIEVGKDKFTHPYPMRELDNLVRQHEGIIDYYTRIAKELWKTYGS